MTTLEFIEAVIIGMVGGLIGRALIVWLYKGLESRNLLGRQLICCPNE